MSFRLFVILLLNLFFTFNIFPEGIGQHNSISSILPLTGDYAHLGNGVKDCLRLAERDFNKIAEGVSVGLIVEDNQGSLEKSTSIAKRGIAQENVKAFISIISGVSQVLKPISRKAGIINLGICSNDEVADGETSFINYITAEQGVKVFLEELHSESRSASLAVFAFNESGFEKIVKELEKQSRNTQVEINSINYFDTSVRDFKPMILRSLKQDIDKIMILGLSPQIELLAKQIRQLGFTQQFVSIESFGLAADKKYFKGAWYVDASVPGKDFERKFKEVYNKDLPVACGHAYDSFMLIAGAISSLQSRGQKVNAIAISDYLKSLKNYQGINGDIRIDLTGVISSPLIVNEITESGTIASN